MALSQTQWAPVDDKDVREEAARSDGVRTDGRDIESGCGAGVAAGVGGGSDCVASDALTLPQLELDLTYENCIKLAPTGFLGARPTVRPLLSDCVSCLPT